MVFIKYTLRLFVNCDTLYMSKIEKLKEKEDLKDLENLDTLYRELNSIDEYSMLDEINIIAYEQYSNYLKEIINKEN